MSWNTQQSSCCYTILILHSLIIHSCIIHHLPNNIHMIHGLIYHCLSPIHSNRHSCIDYMHRIAMHHITYHTNYVSYRHIIPDPHIMPCITPIMYHINTYLLHMSYITSIMYRINTYLLHTSYITSIMYLINSFYLLHTSYHVSHQ